MINILDKKDCCGCGACVQRCPRQCISFQDDREGFSYPVIDKNKCIDCGLCEHVCPELNVSKESRPLHTYAAISNNEVSRKQSSSGGVFSLLAERVINEGGVVFGARFDDNWQVLLDYTETVEGLAAFRGSKYVQAYTGDTFIQCEQFLKTGRKVLFSGTPCHILGLLLFLKKKYTNLITVDVACHGVPSPDVWKEYLKSEVLQNVKSARRAAGGKSTVLSSLNLMSFIKDIRFRDKQEGWKKYRFVLNFNEPTGEVEKSSVLSYTHYNNPYFHAFNMGLIMRPSCYGCIIKNSCRSQSDITLADFWGIETVDKSMDDDLGTSLVLVNTPDGMNKICQLDMRNVSVDYYNALFLNAGLRIGCNMHYRRTSFFSNYKVGEKYDVKSHLFKTLKEPIFKLLLKYVRAVFIKMKFIKR